MFKFLNLILASGLFLTNFWGFPKVSFDPSQTRLPAGVPREALGEDHALIADVFETLSVPFER